MKRPSSILHLSLTLLLILLLAPTLSAAELTYDMAGTGIGQGIGKLSGFDVSQADSNPTINNYLSEPETWKLHGFLGRLNYRGEPTRVTFTNTGPSRTTSPNGMFYFIYNITSTTNTDPYREFFLVAKVKGLYHNGVQHDFTGNNQNFVVSTSGGYFDISKGAGPEIAEIGTMGFNATGGSAIYDGTNQYSFKYPYSYIWVDITFIRTNNAVLTYKNSKNKTVNGYGFYDTSFTVTTKDIQTLEVWDQYTFQLSGQYNQSGTNTNWEYYFGIENILPTSFPFSNLKNKNSASNALPVGKVRYFSTNDSAILTLASNNQGTQTLFKLKSPGAPSFDYTVVYTPTRGNGSQQELTPSTNSFTSSYYNVGSPIGGSTAGEYIEGDVKIYVLTDLLPLSGTYTSDIYCILTRGN